MADHQPPQAEQDQIATSMVVGTVNLPLCLLSEEQTLLTAAAAVCLLSEELPLLTAAAAAIAVGSRRPQTAATKAGRDDTSQT